MMLLFLLMTASTFPPASYGGSSFQQPRAALRGGGAGQAVSMPASPRTLTTTTTTTNTSPSPSVTTQSILDAIAKFATHNPQATYDSTTSTTFLDMFSSCDIVVPAPPFGSLVESQDGAWSGLAHYAETYVNTITLNQNGAPIEIVDEWGSRCSDPNVGDCGARWSECSSSETCTPQVLQVPLHSGTVLLDIDIYEPCNFVSNLAYYRAIPEMCAANLFLGSETLVALRHTFANLAFGSAFWHGSHTYLGSRADVKLIDTMALINHQALISSLAEAHTYVDPVQLAELFHLQSQPRSRTAIETAADISSTFEHLDVSEWTQRLVNLDTPNFELTFAVLISTIATVLFPDNNVVVEQMLTALGTLIGVGTSGLVYLPTIRQLVANLQLSDGERFVLFRQAAGTVCKLLFAFLWQEQVFQIPLFLQEAPNRVGQAIMPSLTSLFNFISGFQHMDNDFQASRGVYPGDETCRPTEPHAKWHELSANGLMDLAFTIDCYASAVTGSGFQCATLSGSNGLDSITLQSVHDWADATLSNPAISFWVEGPIKIAIYAAFSLLDQDFNERLDWADIQHMVKKVDDWNQAIQSFINWWPNLMQNLTPVFQAAQCISDPVACTSEILPDACVTDSMCSNGEKCVFLTCGLQQENQECVVDSDCAQGKCGMFTCGLQNHGQACLTSGDCASGRCDWDTFTCQSKLPSGSECHDDNDCDNNVCTGALGFIPGVCGKQPDGSTCFESSDCESNRCIFGTCGERDDGQFCTEASQCKSDMCLYGECGLQNNGDFCTADNQCQSARCDFVTCQPKLSRGETCNESSDCVSGSCQDKNWFGYGKCS